MAEPDGSGGIGRHGSAVESWHGTGGIGDVASARALAAASVLDQPLSVRDTAVLLADELATNAALHGGGWFEITVRRTAGLFRLEVTDTSKSLPVILVPGPEDEHGRGIQIVDALASRWGATLRSGGKVVWVELKLRGEGVVDDGNDESTVSAGASHASSGTRVERDPVSRTPER